MLYKISVNIGTLTAYINAKIHNQYSNADFSGTKVRQIYDALLIVFINFKLERQLYDNTRAMFCIMSMFSILYGER